MPKPIIKGGEYNLVFELPEEFGGIIEQDAEVFFKTNPDIWISFLKEISTGQRVPKSVTIELHIVSNTGSIKNSVFVVPANVQVYRIGNISYPIVDLEFTLPLMNYRYYIGDDTRLAIKTVHCYAHYNAVNLPESQEGIVPLATTYSDLPNTI